MTVLSSADPVLDLLAATTPAGGGTVAIDLLRPLVPHTLVRDPGPMDQAALLAERFAAAMRGEAAAPALPRAWVRLCVVAGVDRWSTTVLDARLLQVDHALARAEAGEPEQARRLYAGAGPALADLNGSTDSPAVAAELRRVRRTLGAWPGPTRGGVTHAAATLVHPDTAATPGATPVIRGLSDGEEVMTLTIDPLQMSSRLLLGPARYVVRRGGQTVDVRCSAFPGVTAGSAGADRLLLRAVHPRPGGLAPLLSLAEFSLAVGGDEFVGSVSLGGRRADEVAVDIVDAARMTDPRCSADELARVDALQLAQIAYGAVRAETAARVVRPGTTTDAAGFARLLLAPYAESSPAVEDFCATLATPDWIASAAFADDAARPLLAELAAAALRP